MDGPDQAASAEKKGVLALVEDSLLALALALSMLLPLLEALLRKLFSTGVSGAATFEQHLTLTIGMLGAALAARDNRLLAISTLAAPSSGGGKKPWLRWFAAVGGATVAVLLTAAAIVFVKSEREAPQAIAYGVQTWWFELLMPLGFGLVAWRVIRHGAERWRDRALIMAATALLVFLVLRVDDGPNPLAYALLVALLLATALGAPLFAALGGVALLLFWKDGVPLSSVPLSHYSLTTNPTLPTLPLFTLAGYLLAEGGASRRLIECFDAWVGHWRGGPAVVTAVVCAFFTTFTGASGVTILALGALLMPVLVAARIPENRALGLLTGAGSLGLLFPPCLPLILYAIVAAQNRGGDAVSMQQMFLGGLLPGLLLLVAVAWFGVRLTPPLDRSRRRFDAARAWRSLWTAKWELLLPIVALVALFSGWATPVEAAAITALYALVVELFLYRDLRDGRKVLAVFTECGLLIGGVLLVLGVALGFTNWLVDAQVPERGVEWVTATIHQRWIFLLALNLFLLVVGCLMDVYSAIVVVVPLIAPLGKAYGVDPVHLGIVFLANLELGFLTPPIGMNLFLASYRFKKPVAEVARASLPILLVLLVGVLLITYVPGLTTWLPRLLGGPPR